MAQVHVVDEGEHLSAIAARYGYQSYAPIWDHESNAALRAIRSDPHQLLPGDKLVIPAAVPIKIKRSTAATHVLHVQRDKLVLRLRVLDFLGKPVVATEGTLTIVGDSGTTTTPVTTDGSGMFTAPIERTASSGCLEIAEYSFDLAIGALGPVTDASGVTERLGNLGLGVPGPDSPDRDKNEPGHLGIELFQARAGVATTGEWSPDLSDKLVEQQGS